MVSRLLRVVVLAGGLSVLLFTVPSVALADTQGGIDTGDTAWVLASTAMVLLMTPGLGLFYAGMVRRKNALATILQSFIMVCVIGVLWVLYGYSLAFGKDHWGLIGSLDMIGLRNVGFDAYPGTRIPAQAFMIFQSMFAVITPALITGAFAERMRFKAYLVFGILWATLIYDPVAHWVWGPGGWLQKAGAMDFAGGLVVHLSSGVAALCCALVLGRRKGHGRDEFKPHNLTMTLTGTGLLWFGWFGFNAGSALGANSVAVTAFVATNTAGATAAVVWMIVEWLHRGKPTALGVASGAIAGLAAVTPASGFVGPMAAMAIGLVAGIVCYLAIMLKGKFGYDDSLDVFGVHGVGGVWGVLATGLFASSVLNSAVTNPGIFCGGSLIGSQALAVAAVAAYSFVGTWVLLKLTAVFTPLRAEKDDEETGLDLSQHGEVGYSL